MRFLLVAYRAIYRLLGSEPKPEHPYKSGRSNRKGSHERENPVCLVVYISLNQCTNFRAVDLQHSQIVNDPNVPNLII